MNVFASRLQEHVKALGLSSAAAARQAGIGERQFHNYLAGKREPDLATLLLICERLSAEPNTLLGFKTDAKQSQEQASIIAAVGAVLPALNATSLRLLSGIVALLVESDRGSNPLA